MAPALATHTKKPLFDKILIANRCVACARARGSADEGAAVRLRAA